ncbi:MAG: glycyl-radical enzyme activating protein [Clostridia bacterium]|nr:glycyl-radical enzyme activating protein [Clostridia bacterium]
MITEKATGIVTDFKRFAVHDGDGIRTTVFLKGCPLKCVWCHNPESIGRTPELAFYREKCAHCGECVKVCPSGAHTIEDGRHRFHREKCTACGKCENACLAGALKLCGREMSIAEVIKVVAEDKMFYETSNGGMTLSGGEPTLQPGFTLSLLKAAKAEGINTALDTCGLTTREIYEELLPFVDTFLYDIKHITDGGHIRCTGHGNERILENLRFLSDAGARIEIRTPLVPGFNDDSETLHGIGRLLSGVNITRAKLLPYHSYASSKYDALGMENTPPPSSARTRRT